eukprot:gene4609-4818_t
MASTPAPVNAPAHPGFSARAPAPQEVNKTNAAKKLFTRPNQSEPAVQCLCRSVVKSPAFLACPLAFRAGSAAGRQYHFPSISPSVSLAGMPPLSVLPTEALAPGVSTEPLRLTVAQLPHRDYVPWHRRHRPPGLCGTVHTKRLPGSQRSVAPHTDSTPETPSASRAGALSASAHPNRSGVAPLSPPRDTVAEKGHEVVYPDQPPELEQNWKRHRCTLPAALSAVATFRLSGTGSADLTQAPSKAPGRAAYCRPPLPHRTPCRRPPVPPSQATPPPAVTARAPPTIEPGALWPALSPAPIIARDPWGFLQATP